MLNYEKARSLGVVIIDESEFLAILHKHGVSSRIGG